MHGIWMITPKGVKLSDDKCSYNVLSYTDLKTTSYDPEYCNLILKCVRPWCPSMLWTIFFFFHRSHLALFVVTRAYILLIAQYRNKNPDISKITVIPSFSVSLLLQRLLQKLQLGEVQLLRYIIYRANLRRSCKIRIYEIKCLLGENVRSTSDKRRK